MTKELSFENLGSLITIAGTDNCLGYLMTFDGRGTFDAEYGRVDISKENADTHNRLLDEAMLKGLDENCEVGMGGSFYAQKDKQGKSVVKTFMGTLVSDNVTISGRVLTFRRAGKVYRGRTSLEFDLFNFKRVK
jgi:hypothetical protein